MSNFARPSVADQGNVKTSAVAVPRPNLLIIACCMAGIAKSLEPQFWVFYPPHAEPFGAGWAEARLLSSIWGVVLVVTMVAGGMLGDFFGRRRVLLLGLALTISTNLLAMLSISTSWHIWMHLLTLTATAIVLPLALAPLYIFFRDRQRIFAFGWYILTTTITAVLASTIADFGMQLFGWRGAYVFPLATAIAAFGLVYASLPESYIRSKVHLDAIAYAGWTLIVLATVFGAIQLGFVTDWAGPTLILTTVTAGVGIVMVLWWDAHTPGKMTRQVTRQARNIAALIMTGVVIQLVFMGVLQPTYRYFDVVKGYDLVVRTLALLPLLIGMIASLRLVDLLWNLEMIRRAIWVAMFTIAVSIGILAIRPLSMPYYIQAVPLALFGFTILTAKTVWTNAFFQSMIDDYIGLNAGINSATMLIGGALGSVLGGELVVLFGYQQFNAQLTGLLSAERIDRIFVLLNGLSTYTQALQYLDPTVLGKLVWDTYVESYAAAYAQTLWVFVGFCLIGATTVWIGLRVNLRFTGRPPTVDLEASVFEEIP